MITLYDCATAPNPRRARIFLAEKGVTHETVPIDLRAGEQLQPAYRRINPNCTVPALRVEEGLILTDNASIAAYLEARFQDPPLMGRTPREKADIASLALRNGSPAMADRALPGPVNYAQIPELAQRGLARTQHFLEMLDALLAQRRYLAGDVFSVADITAVVAVDFARIVKIKPDERHPHVLRWRALLAERASISA